MRCDGSRRQEALFDESNQRFYLREVVDNLSISRYSPFAFTLCLYYAGRKSLLTLGVEPNVHSAVRRVFNDPLSSRAVAKLAPFMESCLERHVCRWDEIASSGKASSKKRCIDPSIGSTTNSFDPFNSLCLDTTIRSVNSRGLNATEVTSP